MSIVRNFNLYLNAGNGSAPYINVNQYDQGEQWVFTLYKEDGTKYTPSTGAIVGIKADHFGIINTGTVVDGKVVINETQQMTAAAGKAIFELQIDGDTHGTANFIVMVEPKPGNNADYSDSDISGIQQAIDAATLINELADAGEEPKQFILDEVDAWLDAHPEATTTVLDGAITAPKLNQSLWDKLLVNEEASGAVASFDDGADDVPVNSLKVSLEPIQTGTGDPSPTNVRPISGHSSVTVERTGKNLLNVTATSQTVNGVTFTVNADGTVTANGTASSTAEFVIKSDVGGNTFEGMILSGCPSGGGGSTYRLSERVNGSPWAYLANDVGNGVTLPTTTYETVRFVIRVESGVTCNNLVFKPMIRLASDTDETYEPYTSTSYPYSLGQSVYGGTVDLATGVLTLTKGFKNITASDNIQPIGSSGHGWQVYRSSFDNPPLNTGANYSDGVICDRLKTEIGASSVADDLCFINSSGVLRFNLATVYADKAALFSALGEINVSYPIEPQTIQLTPQEVKTLLGYNNISSSGTVDVIYHADTKLYVDKMTAVDNNIIAPTEQTFTASRNYTVNDLVIVNDTLYKVTANIASGSAITPNSNVTVTTLGALIKALS